MDSNLGMKKAKSIKDQSFINYVFDPPSLKNIASVAVAIRMYQCRPVDIEKAVKGEENRKKSIEVVLQRIEKIALPQSLKLEIASIIVPIEHQWTEQAMCFGSCYRRHLKKFVEKRDFSYWTMEGTVDFESFLKDYFDELLHHKDKSFSSLHRIACHYCVEEYISKFFSEISDFESPHTYFPFVAYWIASMRNEDSPYHIKDMISKSIRQSNFIAFKYFWNYKLTEEEKRSNIKDWIVQVLEILQQKLPIDGYFPVDRDDYFLDLSFYSYTYIMCFLLTHLGSHSEQKEIFELYPNPILLSLFCHWPLQRYFLPTFTVMLDFLSEKMYVDFLISISGRMIQTNMLLFRTMWNISPLNLKKSYLNYLKTDDEMELIWRLMRLNDAITINSILRDAMKEDKKEIIFRAVGNYSTALFLVSTDSSNISISTIIAMASKNLSEEDCDWFKRDFMTSYGRCLTNFILKDFISLNIFWDWACSGISLEESIKFKHEYVDLKYMYVKLLIGESWENVNKFLKWYFETEWEIIEFKKSFLCQDNFQHCRSLIGSFSYKGMPASWKLFKKFLNFSFQSSEEVKNAKNEFKAFVLENKYLFGCNDEFSSRLLQWCNV